jgi:hypothetical protein
MGASLSHSYYDAINTRYTGRHWWGGIRNSIPDPLTGGDAQELSRLLSLPGFEDGRTGTDIAIVGADLGRMTEADDVVRERTPSEAATFIASSILWHLWPKFGSQDRTASMSFRVAIDGRDVSIPDPNQVTYIAPFVASLDKLSRGEGREYTRTSKPRRPGQMAHEVTVADPGTLGPSRPVALAAMPFQPPYRHIARMRAAELVVDYFPGPAQPDSMFGYAGVFRASADPLSEDIFAMSEPPTHDAWEERGLGGIALGVIRGSRKFIRDTMTETLMPATPVGGAVSGLGVLAAELAGLIPLSVGTGPGLGGGSTDAGSQGLKPGGLGGSSGSGASGSSGSGGTDQSGNGAKRRSHLPKSPQVKGAPRLSLEAEGLRIAARVIVPESDQQRRVTANAFVVLDGGGRETEPPLGADQPVVLAWRSEPGQAVSEGPTLALGPGECGELTVLVSHVPDAVIRIAFTTQVG